MNVGDLKTMKTFLRYKYLFILLFLLGACHPLHGCVESNLELAPESRLPRWFEVPEGLTRKDVSVTISYWTDGQAEVSLIGPSPKHIVIAEVIGTSRWHPLTEQRGYSKYPTYSYIKVGNIEELIVHRWPGNILHIEDYPAVSEENDLTILKSELEKKEKELSQLRKAGDRFFALKSISELALEVNDFERTIKFSNQLLDWAKTNAGSGLDGDALNKGNIILGRVALRTGNIEKSKSYLIAAGKVPSSSSLSSFGPNMSLAKELLEEGEKDAVLEYLDAVGSFWTAGRGDLAKWKTEIKTGRIPDFGANLDY